LKVVFFGKYLLIFIFIFVMKFKILLLIVSLYLSSCNNKETYNVAVSPSKKMAEYTNMEKIYKKYLEKNGTKYKINLFSDTGFQFSKNIKLLFEDKKDFDMTISNNTDYEVTDSSKNELSQLKVVIPISSRILYIAYNKDKITPTNMNDLFDGKSAVILTYETDFIKNILTDFGVDLTKTNFLKTKFSADEQQIFIHKIFSNRIYR